MKKDIPKVIYAIYDSSEYMEDIVFVSGDKDTINTFMKQRNYNEIYHVAEIDKKDHIKEVIRYAEDHRLYGEKIGDIIFTTSEYEWFAEAYIELIQDILYTLEDRLIKQLKYFKLCDEEIKMILDFVVCIKNKIDMLFADTPSEDDVIYDEDDIFYVEKVAEYFFKENIL